MNLVINSRFRPFTYDEMVKPLVQYKEAYDKVEQDYSNLVAQTEAWKDIATQENSPEAYAMYKEYSDRLNTVVDDFSKGMNMSNRRALIGMKRDYAKNIVPIATAAKRRDVLADEQRKALLQNPTLMFQRDMNSTSYESSLDRFLENPNYDYGERYSGALLTQQVSQAAGNLAKELSNYGNGKRLDEYTKTFLQQHGFTREQVLDAVNNPNRAQSQPVLNAIVEQVMGSSGIISWADRPTRDKAYNYARQGLWSAVGQTSMSTYEDYGARLTAQETMQKRLKDYENQQKQVQYLAINPLNIYSSRELSKDEKDYNDNMKKYSEYFYKEDGQWKMNTKGWKAYNSKKYITGTVSPSTGVTVTQGQFVDSDFKTFMDSLGANGSVGSDSFGPHQRVTIGNLWGRYIDNSPAARTSRYDATKFTEFDYAIDSTQQKDMKNSIMTASRGTTLKEVDFDSKSKTFKNTGDDLKMEDLNSDNYHVIATRFSPYGNTVMIKTSEGEVKRYRMPAGINTTNESNRDKSMQSALQWQSVVTTGKYTDASGRVRQATAKEIRQAQSNYAAALQEAYLYHSQLGVQNKTEEQTYNPYSY